MKELVKYLFGNLYFDFQGEVTVDQVREFLREDDSREARQLLSKIIEENGKKKSDIVQIGSKVMLKEGNYDAETFTIVGAAEANPRDGKISNESPIGKAILNHKIGDTVKVETPGGTYNVKIMKIS